MAALQAGLVPQSAVGSYEETTLNVTSDEGTVKSTLTTRVADNRTKRYVGLSNTESLMPNHGMVFAYNTTENRTFVMRRMNFGLDVIYVSPRGEITAIRSAERPDGPVEYYLNHDSVRGDGQYVIEVNQGWAEENNVQTGDSVSGLPHS